MLLPRPEIRMTNLHRRAEENKGAFTDPLYHPPYPSSAARTPESSAWGKVRTASISTSTSAGA